MVDVEAFRNLRNYSAQNICKTPIMIALKVFHNDSQLAESLMVWYLYRDTVKK